MAGALLLDAIAAAAAYAAGWGVRFGAEAATFLPFARRIFPFILVAQIAALWLAGAYRRTSTAAAVSRFAAGAAFGTVAGALAAWAVYGREGLATGALAAGAMLFVMAGTLWRCVVAVRRLQRRAAAGARLAPPGMAHVGRPASVFFGLRDLVRYRALVVSLVARDLKLKYRGSVLGFVWSLLNPLIMVTVYTIAFTYFFRIRQPDFVLNLLVAILAWTFSAGSALMSTGALIESAGLIRSVYFPRGILPLATVLFNLSQFVLTLAVFLPLMFLWFGIRPGAHLMAFPVFLVLQLAFTAGVAFLLSALSTLYRDVRHLTEVGLLALFWLTPIMYPLALLPERVQGLILLGPVAPFIVAHQQVLSAGVWPAPSVWATAVLYAATALMAGAALFFSLEERFVEQV